MLLRAFTVPRYDSALLQYFPRLAQVNAVKQAAVYDATRTRLLRGREDMLGLLAAQLKHKVVKQDAKARGLVWVDVSGLPILSMLALLTGVIRLVGAQGMFWPTAIRRCF